MCKSVHVGLLLVLIICLMNGSSFAIRTKSIHHVVNDIDINILAIAFTNGMGPNPHAVNLFYNHQRDGVSLNPGQTFSRLDNLDPKSVVMYWNGYCASFLAYDPRQEGGHQRIFWLMKEDGVYHSWDNSSWQKRVNWKFNQC